MAKEAIVAILAVILISIKEGVVEVAGNTVYQDRCILISVGLFFLRRTIKIIINRQTLFDNIVEVVIASIPLPED